MGDSTAAPGGGTRCNSFDSGAPSSSSRWPCWPRAGLLLGTCATDASAANDEACLSDFISRFGRRALRRPVGEDDVAFYRAAVSEPPVSALAVQKVVALMLTAPEFLYFVEHGQADVWAGPGGAVPVARAVERRVHAGAVVRRVAHRGGWRDGHLQHLRGGLAPGDCPPGGQQRAGVQHAADVPPALLPPRLPGPGEQAGGSGHGRRHPAADHTLLAWGQESGNYTHDHTSAPIVAFGGAEGFFRTGHYCDYRNLAKTTGQGPAGEPRWFGLLWHQWLETVLQSMGLPRAEWEDTSQCPGYPSYRYDDIPDWAGPQGSTGPVYPDSVWSAAGEVLPFLRV